MSDLTIKEDLPALVALGLMAEVDPSRMAEAFSDPEHFFTHLTLPELRRIQEACEAFDALRVQMAASMDRYFAYAKGVLETIAAEA